MLLDQIAGRDNSADKIAEERMWTIGTRFKLGMKLRAEQNHGCSAISTISTNSLSGDNPDNTKPFASISAR